MKRKTTTGVLIAFEDLLWAGDRPIKKEVEEYSTSPLLVLLHHILQVANI